MWTQLPQKKSTLTPTQLLAYIYCGQMAEWMKTPLGMEVDLCRGHIVLDGVPAPVKGHSSPLFLAHVYCGHGRPSQLLLSSCCMKQLLLQHLFNGLFSRTTWVSRHQKNKPFWILL